MRKSYVYLKKEIKMRRILCALTTGMVLGSGLLADLKAQAATFLPDFSAATFDLNSSISDNTYFPLTPGTVYNYGGEKVDPVTGEIEFESNEVSVTFETRDILGVTTRVVRDRAFVNDVLVEDTFDWYAQDTGGNVWYLGELATNYRYDDNGGLIGTDNAGSWEGGVNGALPGFIMEANPQVGDNYYQEFAPNDRAIDQAEVVSLNESISIGLGDFDNVLKTLEFTTLEPDLFEFKNYAPGIGLVLVEEELNAEQEPAFTVELLGIRTVEPEAVPEPTAVLGLLGVGLFGFRMRSRGTNQTGKS